MVGPTNCSVQFSSVFIWIGPIGPFLNFRKITEQGRTLQTNGIKSFTALQRKSGQTPLLKSLEKEGSPRCKNKAFKGFIASQ